MSKYGHRTLNWFEAIVNKLGGEEAAERFLRSELVVSKPTCRWREYDGVIYLTATSDGTTGEAWITRLQKKGFRVPRYVKSLLRSPDFKPTIGVIYEIALLKGMLFESDNRVTKKIRDEAEQRQLIKPNAEVACLIRESFSDEEIEQMGLWWIVVMHEPIKSSDKEVGLLVVNRVDGEGRRLDAFCLNPEGWHRRNGFAFVLSQVGPQD